MNKVFERRMKSAQTIWFGQVARTNAQIARTKSDKRKQSLRKSVVDSAMRYTVLYNKVADWALRYFESGQKVPTVSAKLNSARQEQALKALDGADWLNDLQLFDVSNDALQDAGADYNADWLMDHDRRWALEALALVAKQVALAQENLVAEVSQSEKAKA